MDFNVLFWFVPAAAALALAFAAYFYKQMKAESEGFTISLVNTIG